MTPTFNRKKPVKKQKSLTLCSSAAACVVEIICQPICFDTSLELFLPVNIVLYVSLVIITMVLRLINQYEEDFQIFPPGRVQEKPVNFLFAVTFPRSAPSCFTDTITAHESLVESLRSLYPSLHLFIHRLFVPPFLLPLREKCCL